MKNILLLFLLLFSQISFSQDCATFQDWPMSDPLGGPNQGSWCEWCIDYENNGFTNFNPLGINWGDPNIMCDCCSVEPIESYNCTADGCVDPGDGTGTYTSYGLCLDLCVGCDVYDSWPVSDPNGGINQNSWCEWCIDYENNGFTNFNPIGINWANPDLICDCCDSGLNINQMNINKEVIKTINILGQELNNIQDGFIIYLYNDGSTEKVFIKE